jgi:hypothetical protein
LHLRNLAGGLRQIAERVALDEARKSWFFNDNLPIMAWGFCGIVPQTAKKRLLLW